MAARCRASRARARAPVRSGGLRPLLLGLARLTAAAPAPPAEEPERGPGSALTVSLERLRRWLEAGGADISHALGPYHSPERGNELRAADGLSEGEVLATIPLSLVVDGGAAVLASPLAAAVAALWEQPQAGRPRAPLPAGEDDFWAAQRAELAEGAARGQVALASFLLDHWSRGEASAFEPWLATVPRSLPGCPVLWASDQLQCLGSLEERSLAAEKQQRWLREYQTILHYVPGMQRFAFETFARARAAVESRTHGVLAGKRGEEKTAFVPLADLLNHNHTPSALWTVSPGPTPHFRLTTARPLAAGAALPCSYGRKSHQELFLVYGFADVHAPRAVSVQVTLPRHDPHRGERLEVLLEAGAYRSFTVRSGGPAMEARDFALLLALLRGATAPPELLNPEGLLAPLPSAAEASALGLLAETAAEALSALKTEEGHVGLSLAAMTCNSYKDHLAEVFLGVQAFAEGKRPLTGGVSAEVALSLQELYAVHVRTAGAETQEL